jgi:hypothetical protein
MTFRTNYRFQRTERDRVKKAKKEEKLKRRQEHSAEPPAADSPTHAGEHTQPDE